MTGTFLTGVQLADKIREICAADAVDCAVAFWSGTSRDEIFPRWREQKVRIICDISMGCNSQRSLEAYGAPDNKLLRVCDGLHAKIFISDAGAVVGSANASFNGLGRSGTAPGNLEAGVFFEVETDGWVAARAFFHAQWGRPAPIIDQDQLNRAPQIARDPGPAIGSAARRSDSIFERVLAYPSAFEGTLFVITASEISDAAEKKLEGAHEQAKRRKIFEPAERELVLQDAAKSLAKASERVLMFWFGDPAKPKLYAYHNGVRISAGRLHAIYAVEGWKHFWRELSMDVPARKTAMANDEEIARRLCPSAKARRDGWVGTAHELADELKGMGYPPSF